MGMEVLDRPETSAEDSSAPAEKVVIALEPIKDPKGQSYEKDDADEDPVEESPKAAVVESHPSKEFPAKAILGTWKCVDTKGLDEYLKESGCSWGQRRIACAA